MTNISKISLIFLIAVASCFYCATVVLASTTPQIQTNYATNIQNTSATLNGYLSDLGSYGTATVYFQWGTTTSYVNQTSSMTVNYIGSFNQAISGLAPNTTFYFRAVAQNSYGTVYGQNMSFTTADSNYYGNGTLTVTKKVINLSSGNLNWQNSVLASPNNILSFAVTLQASNQNVNNVIVRDILPANLIYKGNLTVNTSTSYSGDITSGINIGTISAGQIVVVAYQAQVANSTNFAYGTTTLTNNATISSQNGTQTSTATVIVNRSQVYGASSVSTGLTNNFLTDSFFLPLLLIILGLWLYFSGLVYGFADWLKKKV